MREAKKIIMNKKRTQLKNQCTIPQKKRLYCETFIINSHFLFLPILEKNNFGSFEKSCNSLNSDCKGTFSSVTSILFNIFIVFVVPYS